MRESRKFIEEIKAQLAGNPASTIDDLNKVIQKVVKNHSKKAANDFEDFLPQQIHQIIYDPFNNNGVHNVSNCPTS